MALDKGMAIADRTAWPLRVVVDDANDLSGVLMELIPDRFFHTLQYAFGGSKREDRHAEWLCAPESYCSAVNASFPDTTERLLALADLVQIIAGLHAEEIVFGDLNPRNVLFASRTAEPKVQLIDCDAVRRRGSAAVVPQMQFPDWSAPEERSGRGATFASDTYKLGLFIIRCLAPSEGIAQIKRFEDVSTIIEPKLRTVDATGALSHAVRMALSLQPTDRPVSLELLRPFFKAGYSDMGATMCPSLAAPATQDWSAPDKPNRAVYQPPAGLTNESSAPGWTAWGLPSNPIAASEDTAPDPQQWVAWDTERGSE